MQLFALQTDIDRLKARFLVAGEQEVFTIHRHVISFFLHLLRPLLATVVLIAVGVGLRIWEMLSLWPVIVLLIVWLLTAARWVFNAYIDWKYDFLFLTTKKLVVVDQKSIIRNAVNSMNLEEISSVVAETQWLNLFGFGRLHITTRRGEGEEDIIISFIPHPDVLAGAIMNQISQYQ
ncbi:MAG: hypothetical protein PHZ00_07980 [Candidatus Peribacteraceae bacterium]|nr:hypothetical protein [Candidatus Peribacteraceae bacterium]